MEVLSSGVRNWNAPRVQAGDIMSEDVYKESMSLWRTYIVKKTVENLLCRNVGPVASASPFSRNVGGLYFYLLVTNSLKARFYLCGTSFQLVI